jgi:hypothetical protein
MRRIATVFVALGLAACGSQSGKPNNGTLSAQIGAVAWTAVTTFGTRNGTTLDVTAENASHEVIEFAVADVTAPGTYPTGPGLRGHSECSLIQNDMIYMTLGPAADGVVITSLTDVKVSGTFSFALDFNGQTTPVSNGKFTISF